MVSQLLFARAFGRGHKVRMRETMTVLCVARIDRQKNQMLLVEWMGRHTDAKVRLVGPVTQPDYRAELEARAAALGVAGHLTVVGALKPDSPELVSEYKIGHTTYIVELLFSFERGETLDDVIKRLILKDAGAA